MGSDLIKPHNEQDEINNISFGSPHVVILGAGASRAAFPQGDDCNSKLPLMEDFVEVVGLTSILNKYDFKDKNVNFESLYSSLHGKPQYLDLIREIELRVYEYFSSLKMPSVPTLYDHLVLSLRPKDIIATFNWDPFLYWSLCRNHTHADMPHPVFLHGNVYIGYCLKDKTMGVSNQKCSKCGNTFTNTPLLYPVTRKNYTDNEFIKTCWDEIKKALRHGYILTIFGYSAPKTDVEAISLLKEGWGKSEDRELEEIEIIDIKDDHELYSNWKDFIHSHHYGVTDSIYNSFILKHPRRSCEALWETLMMVNPYPDRNLPKDAPFDELWDWFKPLIEIERRSKKQK